MTDAETGAGPAALARIRVVDLSQVLAAGQTFDLTTALGLHADPPR